MFLLLSNSKLSKLSIMTKAPVKCVLPNKKLYPFVDNSLTFFDSSSNSFSTTTYFALFEATLLFKLFSLSSESVSFTKSVISHPLTNFYLLSLHQEHYS